MRRAALLYNPLSGGRRERRLAEVEAGLAILRAGGVKASAAPTLGGTKSAAQAREFMAQGCDTILACGGDGTVHDLLQAMVGEQAALGIIPLGTANALAHDLKIPLEPVAAARAALDFQAHRLAVGRVQYQDFSGNPASRYFTVAVGVGVDARLFYKLNLLIKGRLGMAAYYAKATRLWLTDPLEHFEVDVAGAGRLGVSQLLAVRIRYFGGVLRVLAPGASLQRKDLRLVLFRTRSRLTYLRYILRGLLGTTWRGAGIELADAPSVTCRSLAERRDGRVFVEADGELLGTVPAEISMVPDAVSLLAP